MERNRMKALRQMSIWRQGGLRAIVIMLSAVLFVAAANGTELFSGFANPPNSTKPWCYWWWVNGHVDRKTITADLESMKSLGFGGVLMFDSRGYWDDDDHVVNPKADLDWGGERWFDRVEFSIRECARLGLEFTMNASASGGTLNGFKDGREYEVNVFNRDEVRGHLDHVIGPLIDRVPELVGPTFTHIYSISYEGKIRDGGTWQALKDNLYMEMREWAHKHGLKVYSEAAGPWAHGARALVLQNADNASMFDYVDFPQGEFWPQTCAVFAPSAGHANANARYFCRAATVAARRKGFSIVSAEAFTHMHLHWSVDPAFLKPTADQAFADGINHLVFHTFTCSPTRFGVPGLEYFAGSHINRNVTWHHEAAPFIRYLGRCQYMLRRGKYVDDGEFAAVKTNYYGWGRFRKDGRAQFTTTHRREGATDWFFVAGEGRGDVVLNAASDGRAVEIWDAVTACRRAVAGNALPGRKTRVSLDLPTGGSCFVVFLPEDRLIPSSATCVVAPLYDTGRAVYPMTNIWHVSFAYHDGVSAVPPAPVEMSELRDWTSYGEKEKAESTSLRYFSGTATYRTTFAYDGHTVISQPRNLTLSLGTLPSGLAHVFVNGTDCGTVWCAPWEVDVSSVLHEGANEIVVRYTNNWHNRLVGDCTLPVEKRVTQSNVHYWSVRQYGNPGQRQVPKPRLHTGPAANDPLQKSGLLGPVSVLVYSASQGIGADVVKGK